MTGCLTLLARLGRDNAGNTLAIAAASLLPMMALIGGGVDISRAYMAKTQLQSACDAGVLAGRKAMSKSGSYGDSEKAKADSMFNFNFNGKGLSIDTDDVSYTTDDNEDGQVLGTATAVVPTLMMKIFGKDEVDLSVNCMAELQIGNADIMFVLDTTGSMDRSISSGDPKKIQGLRDAVRDFHRTIKQSVNDSRTRIRYGFVPYSSTVNARGLVQSDVMPTDYFTDSTNYRSRVPYFGTKVNVADEPEEIGSGVQTYGSPTAISQAECNLYGENDYPNNGDNPARSGTAPNPVTFTEYNSESWTPTGTREEEQRVRECNRWGCSWKWKTVDVPIGTCERRYVQTRVTYETWWKFSNWIYQNQAVDTSLFKTLEPVSVATDISNAMVDTRGDYNVVLLSQMQTGTAPNGLQAMNVGTTNYTWNGCLEERQTVSAETDFDPIPDSAFDLDFDMVPSSPETRWHPMWGDIEYTQYGGRPSSACPSPMMLLQPVSLADDASDVDGVPSWLDTYVNNLNPEGNTYHDIGMIWGGRLTSPTGLFADNVNLDSDKINVSKHIIFMTDGIMEPSTGVYSAYGIESYDHRIAPSGTDSDELKAYHTARFNAVCDAIKAQGTTIWVVAFGTSMTDSLRDCASDGRAYYSSNTEALRNTFKFIAAQVADLRLGA